MTLETHPQYQPRTVPLRAALYLTNALLLLLLAYTSRRFEIEPFWVLLAVPVALVLPILVRRFPVVLMVAMVYVGTFKTRGAVGVSLTDPTLVTAALLYAAVILQSLLLAVGAEGRSLRDMFAGQMGGVTAFGLLILVIAVSYSYTPAPDLGGEKVLKLAVFDVPIFLAPLVLLRHDRDVRQLLILYILGSLVLACRTAYRVLHPTTELLLGVQDPTEIGEGLLMGAAALMALYYSFPERRLFRAGLISCIVVLTCGTTASLSRSAIFSLLLVGTTSLLFLRRTPTTLSRKTILTAAAAVLVSVSLVSILLSHLPATHSKFAHKASELSLTSQGIYPPSGTAGQRYSFSEFAWQAFLAKPVLGWGVGGWSTLWHYSDDRVLKYPHNFVLEIAAEQGLAGLAALSMLLLAMSRACTQIVRGQGRRFIFIVPVVALSMLGNAVTGQIDARDMWFCCGTLFALARLTRAGSASPL
jgi:O-antigen ligase